MRKTSSQPRPTCRSGAQVRKKRSTVVRGVPTGTKATQCRCDRARGEREGGWEEGEGERGFTAAASNGARATLAPSPQAVRTKDARARSAGCKDVPYLRWVTAFMYQLDTGVTSDRRNGVCTIVFAIMFSSAGNCAIFLSSAREADDVPRTPLACAVSPATAYIRMRSVRCCIPWCPHARARARASASTHLLRKAAPVAEGRARRKRKKRTSEEKNWGVHNTRGGKPRARVRNASELFCRLSAVCLPNFDSVPPCESERVRGSTLNSAVVCLCPPVSTPANPDHCLSGGMQRGD